MVKKFQRGSTFLSFSAVLLTFSRIRFRSNASDARTEVNGEIISAA